ncbi:putative uncharacterized protein [Bacteroides ovatus CAG:22]|nr:putative uncharacterized protein [Bacteroides ovatus CAG:22]
MEEYVCPSGGVLLKCGDTFFKATVLLVRHGRDEILPPLVRPGRDEILPRPW